MSIRPVRPGKAGAGADFDRIEDVIADVAVGRMVIMVDDEDRENEGDLIMAAEHATEAALGFIVRHSSGIVCAPMLRSRLDALRLPLMVEENTDTHRTAFTVTVDYKHGTTTGISAADRARTLRALADPEARPDDFSRPGHVFPLRYAAGGVLARAGHTEASVDLVRLARCKSAAAVICEIVNDDGSVTRGEALFEFARRHGLRVGTIADLIRYRLAQEHSVERIAEQLVHTEFGDFRLIVYEDRVDHTAHLAMVMGTVSAEDAALVRVHVRNSLQDVLSIQHTTFGWPVRNAMRRIAQEGAGVLLLLRQRESTVEFINQLVGIEHKARGQDAEGSTDLRTHGIGAQILSDLGVRRMRVLSTPRRVPALSGFGLEIVEYVACD